MSPRDAPKPPEDAKDQAPQTPDVDSAGVYFMSIEEFEGRPIRRKDGVREADSPAKAEETEPARSG